MSVITADAQAASVPGSPGRRSIRLGRVIAPPIRSPSCAAPSSRAARALRDGEPTEPAPVPRPPAEARAGRLQLQRGDAAGGAAGRQPARRRRAPRRASSSASLGGERAASSGSRSPAPASSTSSSPTPGTGGRWPAWPAPARTSARRRPTRPERILVEFVSANPTGPLHVGGGRHAAYGDALVRLLRGGRPRGRARVLRQRRRRPDRPLRRLDRRPHDAASELPEDGYEGEYVAELAERIAAEGIDPADLEAVGARGDRADAGGGARRPCDRFGVRFDTWFSERDLYEPRRGRARPSPSSTRRGHTYRQRGRALAAHDRPSATTRTGC